MLCFVLRSLSGVMLGLHAPAQQDRRHSIHSVCLGGGSRRSVGPPDARIRQFRKRAFRHRFSCRSASALQQHRLPRARECNRSKVKSRSAHCPPLVVAHMRAPTSVAMPAWALEAGVSAQPMPRTLISNLRLGGSCMRLGGCLGADRPGLVEPCRVATLVAICQLGRFESPTTHSTPYCALVLRFCEAHDTPWIAQHGCGFHDQHFALTSQASCTLHRGLCCTC